MRILACILAMVAFASCATGGGAVRWPNVDATYECSAMVCPSAEATEDAAAAFVVAWYAYFGDVCTLEGLHVSWEPLIAENILGRYWAATDTMQVRVNPGHPDRVANTSLAHELVHMCLWKTKGDPDATHEHEPGPWNINVQLFLDLFDEFLRKQATHEL